MLIRQALDPARACYEVADDRPRRDHLFVDDLIELAIACRRCPGEIYNAGSGISVGIADLVAEINLAAGVSKPLRSRGEGRPEEVLDVVADIRRAAAELNWRPRVSLREGIAATVASFRA